MRLSDAEPSAVLAQIRAACTATAAGTDPRHGPAELCAKLCDQGWWLAACRAAVQTDDPWLNSVPPNMTDRCTDRASGAGEHALEVIREQRPESLGRACAVLYAGRAARLADPGGAEARSLLLLAARSWTVGDRTYETDLDTVGPVTGAAAAGGPLEKLAADYPRLPWRAVEQLLRHLKHGAPTRLRSVQTSVLLGAPATVSLETLVLEAVADPVEQLAPNLDRMLFSTSLDRMNALLQPAFHWARAQEQFPPGHGVRWSLLHPGGQPVAQLPPAHPAGAAAVALGRLFPPRRLHVTRIGWAPKDADPRVVVHADLTPVGDLTSVATHDRHLPSLTLGPQNILLVANADQAAAIMGPDRPKVRAAGDVRTAIKYSRRLARAARWATAVAVALTVLAGTGAYVANGLNQQADDHRIAIQAEVLGDQAIQESADSPSLALRSALAAQSLAPGTPTSRSALLSAVDRDLRIRHVLPTRSAHVTALAVDQHAHYVAVLGTDHHLHTWNIQARTEVPVPAAVATGVHAIAYPADGGPLTVATATEILRWNPATPHTTAQTIAQVAAPLDLAVSADGLVTAWSTADGTIGVQDERTPGSTRTLHFSPRAIDVITVTPNGDTLAFGDAGGRFALWHWRSSMAPLVTRAGSSPLTSVAFARSHVYAVDATTLYAFDATTARTLMAPVTLPDHATVTYRPQAQDLLFAVVNGVKEVPDDPSKLGTPDGAPSAGTDLVAFGTHVGSVVALSGDDQSAAVPTADGSVLVYAAPSTYPIDMNVQVGYIQATHPIPRTSQRLYVSSLNLGTSERSSVVTYDTARQTAQLTRVTIGGKPVGVSASSFSPRHSTLALATYRGPVLLYPVRNGVLGPPGVINGPAGEVARGAFFDDARQELICLWSHTLIVYSTASPIGSGVLHRSRIPDAVMAGELSRDGEHLFLGSTRGLYMLPRQDGYAWTSRTVLSHRFTTNIKALPDGSAVAMSYSGGLAVYHETNAGTWATPAGTWAETAITGRGVTSDALVAGDDFVGSASTSALHLYSASDGRPLVTIGLGDMFAISTWYDGKLLHIYGDIAGVGAEIPVNQDELIRLACGLIGPAAGNISSAWPSAPSSVRDHPLCRTPD